jgi:hypothetical protein
VKKLRNAIILAVSDEPICLYFTASNVTEKNSNYSKRHSQLQRRHAFQLEDQNFVGENVSFSLSNRCTCSFGSALVFSITNGHQTGSSAPVSAESFDSRCTRYTVNVKTSHELFRCTHLTRTRITRPTDATVVRIVLITVRAGDSTRRTPNCVVCKDQYLHDVSPTCQLESIQPDTCSSRLSMSACGYGPSTNSTLHSLFYDLTFLISFLGTQQQAKQWTHKVAILKDGNSFKQSILRK